MPFEQTPEADAEAAIRSFEEIIAQNPGILKQDAIESVKQALGDLVPCGHYTGPAFGIRVTGIGCNPEVPIADGFFVEFQRLRDGVAERSRIALFLETYRHVGADIV